MAVPTDLLTLKSKSTRSLPSDNVLVVASYVGEDGESGSFKVADFGF